jgi:hypothetical protein
MKNLYLSAVLLCAVNLTASAQNSYPMETVGSPSSPCLVTNYSGWTNNGVLSFSGNAEVQNVNPSNNLSASGGGNVYFTNVTGTYMEISGFSTTSTPQSLDITFGMYGYNPSNLSELVLEYSTDGGTTYTPLTYKRLFRNYFPPTPWDVMVSDPLPGSINFASFKVRFRQTTASQQFRVDDIEANFYYTLPIKLTSFSAQQSKNTNQLQWKANSTDEHEYFVVEKSNDGRKFTAIANVQVKGVGDYSYNFSDQSAGKTFYRLKLVDVSGRSTYSQVLYLQSSGNVEGIIQKIYPVPARQTINTQLLSSQEGNATLTLTDMSGRVIFSKVYSLTQGFNNCSIDVQKFTAGMYILKIVTGSVAETKPVMIQ